MNDMFNRPPIWKQAKGLGYEELRPCGDMLRFEKVYKEQFVLHIEWNKKLDKLGECYVSVIQNKIKNYEQARLLCDALQILRNDYGGIY